MVRAAHAPLCATAGDVPRMKELPEGHYICVLLYSPQFTTLFE